MKPIEVDEGVFETLQIIARARGFEGVEALLEEVAESGLDQLRDERDPGASMHVS